MDRFVSRFVNKVDAKGRVSVPATFRAILSRARGDTPSAQPIIYASPAAALPTLNCGGEPLMEEVSSLMADLPPFSEERDLLATALLGGAHELRLDGDGRVMLSADLRDHADIKDQAAFVGLGHKFQIWSPERFAERSQLAAARVDELKGLLPSRSPGNSPGSTGSTGTGSS